MQYIAKNKKSTTLKGLNNRTTFSLTSRIPFEGVQRRQRWYTLI